MKGTSLGVLGLGSQTTAFYLKELNRVYNQIKGGYSTCPFLLLNTNFDAINSLLPGTSKQLDTVTQNSINELEKLAVQHILIPNITLHKTIDRLSITNKILHPIYLTASKIKENKWSKIILFGSLHTMQSDYMRSIFESKNIEIALPSKEDMLFIDKVRKQVYLETATEELVKNYHLIIEKYTVNYPVVLACTELSIFKPSKKNVNLLDMAQVQILEAVQTVL